MIEKLREILDEFAMRVLELKTPTEGDCFSKEYDKLEYAACEKITDLFTASGNLHILYMSKTVGKS